MFLFPNPASPDWALASRCCCNEVSSGRGPIGAGEALSPSVSRTPAAMLFIALLQPRRFLSCWRSVYQWPCLLLSKQLVCLSVPAPALLAMCPQDLGAHTVFSACARELPGWVPPPKTPTLSSMTSGNSCDL